MKTLFRRIVAVAASVGCGIGAVPADDDPVDESKVPPVRYTLQIGDQQIEIREGQPVSLSGSFTNPELKLKAEPHRVFPYRGLSFEYPRDYTFEYERDPFSATWTVAGTDYTVMLMEYALEVTPAELLDGIRDELETTSQGREPAEMRLAGRSEQAPAKVLKGIQEKFPIGSELLHYEVLVLPRYRGRYHLLVLMDVLDAERNFSADARRTRKLIAETLRLSEQDL